MTHKQLKQLIGKKLTTTNQQEIKVIVSKDGTCGIAKVDNEFISFKINKK